MALYEVSRNDSVAPGEFVSAYVVAGGTALARKAVAHMDGVNGKNVDARRVDVSGRDLVPAVLSTYFDESPTLADAVAEGDDTHVGLAEDGDTYIY